MFSVSNRPEFLTKMLNFVEVLSIRPLSLVLLFSLKNISEIVATKRGRVVLEFKRSSFSFIEFLKPANSCVICKFSIFTFEISVSKLFISYVIILWNNYYKRFSGYLLKSLNLKPFGRFYSNRKFFQLEKFLKSSYIDLECSFFDLFKMFQKNFKISIPVLSLKENIFLKITRIRKAENQILKNLNKNSFVLKKMLYKFKEFILKKSKMFNALKNLFNTDFILTKVVIELS